MIEVDDDEPSGSSWDLYARLLGRLLGGAVGAVIGIALVMTLVALFFWYMKWLGDALFGWDLFV